MNAVDLFDIVSVQLAAAVVLILPGVLVALLPGRRIPDALSNWLDPLQSLVLSGFLISIGLNVAIAFLLSLIGLSIQWTLLFIAAIAMVCGVALYRREDPVRPDSPIDKPAWVLLVAVFVVMSINGGLVSILADSWWHMAYVNRIQETGTVFLERHHLLGGSQAASRFAYEPGWHINIALIGSLSGAPLPLIWHILGAWCSVFLLIAYGFLARVLTGNRGVTLGAMALFVVLQGGINSYLRVSPWPGNVSFTIMYTALAFVLVATESNYFERVGTVRRWIPPLHVFGLAAARPVVLAVVVLLCALISAIHLAEGLWLVSALAFYSYFLTLSRGHPGTRLERDRNALGYLWLWFFGAWGALAVARDPARALDVLVVVASLAAVYLLWLGRISSGSVSARVVTTVIKCTGIAVLVYLTVNFPHLWELFRPDAGKDNPGLFYIPQYVSRPLGNWLVLPNWEHQLRSGLLFSGISGVVVSVLLLLEERTRATVFLSACAVMAFLTLVSPFLFTFFSQLVEATGVYRYQVLIFHPIILALAVSRLWHRIVARQTDARRA